MKDNQILSVYELNDIISGLKLDDNESVKTINLYSNNDVTMDIIKVNDSDFLVGFKAEKNGEVMYSEEAYEEKETYSAYIMTYFKYMEEVRNQ